MFQSRYFDKFQQGDEVIDESEEVELVLKYLFKKMFWRIYLKISSSFSKQISFNHLTIFRFPVNKTALLKFYA